MKKEKLDMTEEKFEQIIKKQNQEQDKRMKMMIQDNNVLLRKEMKMVFNEGIQQLVIPQFDRVFSELKEIKNNQIKHNEDNKAEFEEVHAHFNRVDRKLDAEVDRDDRPDEKIAELEKKIAT